MSTTGARRYGSAWRDDGGSAGLTDLEDLLRYGIGVVGHHLGDARAASIAVFLGGYLSLLGLAPARSIGRWHRGRPDRELSRRVRRGNEPLRSFDRAIFRRFAGEVREALRSSSPISYVEKVDAPVLILAGSHDPRCPIGQVNSYVARLEELGKEHEVYRYDAGTAASWSRSRSGRCRSKSTSPAGTACLSPRSL